MSIDIGWVVLISALCFIAGVAVTIVAAAFLATPPMGGYAGATAAGPRDDP